MRILNAAQMREADRRTIEDIGIPSLVLMENAGRQVVAAMESLFEDLAERRVAVVCGKGNNGGDGFVVARTLHQRGVDVSVFLVGPGRRGQGRRAHQPRDPRPARHHRRRGGRRERVGAALLRGRRRTTSSSTRIFGTGLKTPLPGLLRDGGRRHQRHRAFRSCRSTCHRACRPTRRELIGDCDRGDDDGHARRAQAAAGAAAGRAEVRRGRDRRHRHSRRASSSSVDGPRVELLTREQMRPLITPRAADAHKGDFGRVLIVAGSRGKTGAAVLAAAGRAAVGRGPGDGGRAARSCLPIIAAYARAST